MQLSEMATSKSQETRKHVCVCGSHLSAANRWKITVNSYKLAGCTHIHINLLLLSQMQTHTQLLESLVRNRLFLQIVYKRYLGILSSSFHIFAFFYNFTIVVDSFLQLQNCQSFLALSIDVFFITLIKPTKLSNNCICAQAHSMLLTCSHLFGLKMT